MGKAVDKYEMLGFVMTHKDTLVDLLIHDLTGPLSIVATSVNNLLNKEERYGPYNDSHKEALRRVKRNADKAKALLQEIIEVYRSEEGLFRKEHFLVEEVLRDALRDAVEVVKPDVAEALCNATGKDDLDRILQNNGIYIEIKGKYSNSPFIHDQKKVGQIIRNLISNALKYRKKEIKLSIAGDVDLLISVEDDGQGIPKEKQDYIFKRFLSLEKNKGAPEGLGFGLSCVKSIIETMGGDISLKSGEEGGSCFTARIPPLCV
jgi:signal transduction histidine kinase